MSPYLEKLIEEWRVESELFEISSKRMNTTVSNLASLNKRIYARCIEESIHIEDLELTKKS